MVAVVGVRFKEAGKIYYFDPAEFNIEEGQNLVVETARGIEFGSAMTDVINVEEKDIVAPLKPVLRIADESDLYVYEENQRKALEALDIATELIEKHELPMKLIDCEYTFDSNKVIFYFGAENRVDFRELVRDLAAIFRIRIELKQIGIRDQAKMVGGIGVCGRVSCCKEFLSEFQPVSIQMAKEQSISLNPSKISGLCGRLMCCLNYEQCVYDEKLKELPPNGTIVITEDGEGPIISKETLTKILRVKVRDEHDNDEINNYHLDDVEITDRMNKFYSDPNEISKYERD